MTRFSKIQINLIFQLHFQQTPIYFIRLIFIMANKFLVIFIPCYLGNRILTRSSELQDAAFQLRWYQQDKKYKKSLMIFKEYLKIPLQFGIGSNFHLNLNQFLEILNATYSFYTILKQLQQKFK